MKQELNEQLNRIKSMMGSIQEQSFDIKQEEGPSEQIKQQVASSLHDFLKDGSYNDSECDLNDGFIELSGDDSGETYIKYSFDVNVESYPWSTPGKWTLPNGDPGYPDEGEGLIWSIENVHIEFGKHYQDQEGKWNQEVYYTGKDFTNFLNQKMSNGKDVESWLMDQFDDKLNDLATDRD